jgi:DNA-binding CsgD family transcriptional regulator
MEATLVEGDPCGLKDLEVASAQLLSGAHSASLGHAATLARRVNDRYQNTWNGQTLYETLIFPGPAEGVAMESTSSAAARRRGELLEQGANTFKAGLDLVGLVEDLEDLESLDTLPSDDVRTLDGQLAILGGLMRERLSDASRELSRDHVVQLSRTLHDVHSVRFGIHDHLGHERLVRMDELDRGLSRLRRVADQDQLLEVACEAAAESCGFDRVMLSQVDEDVWRPSHSYARSIGSAERSFQAWMHDVPSIRLSHMMLESELVRRREPSIVGDALADSRTYRPLAELANLTAYVAAPVVADDRVIGLLHADNRHGGVTDLDRDILWFFAIGFAQIFERAVLLARLRDQRAEVMQAMKSVEVVLDELASTEIELSTRERTTALTASRPVHPVVADRPQVLEGLLTSRELEVLALMATGATNDRIAQRLVIGTQTVKSHVKQVLRKLRVENRAEAISQYLRLTIGARDD